MGYVRRSLGDYSGVRSGGLNDVCVCPAGLFTASEKIEIARDHRTLLRHARRYPTSIAHGHPNAGGIHRVRIWPAPVVDDWPQRSAATQKLAARPGSS